LTSNFPCAINFQDKRDLFAGYAEAEFSCRQAGMIKDWGEMEISKKTRFVPLIKLLLSFGFTVTTFGCLETYSGD
jgi:hypothetical protein